MIKYQISLILSLFFVLASCEESETPKDDNDIEWLELAENNYSVSYPSDWTMDNSGSDGTSFMIKSPSTSIDDQFKENVNLLIQDLTGMGVDLDDFVDLSVNQISTVIEQGEMIKNNRESAYGIEYQNVSYLGSYGNYKLKFEQFCWVKDDHAYVLTFTAEEDQFDQFERTAKKILKSFQFTD